MSAYTVGEAWRRSLPCPRATGRVRTHPALLVACAIFVLYVTTRMLLLWRFPAFWDESFYAVQAQTALDFPATRFSELADNKGPLFVWLAMGPIWKGVSPLIAVRLISIFSGIATATVTGLLARRMAGPIAGLLAALTYVLLPYFLAYDVHGFVDPLLTALLMGALYLEIQQAERTRLDRAFGLGLVVGLAVLTRDLGWLATLLLPFSLMLFDWSPVRRLARLGRWAGCSLVSLALAGVCHSVMLLSPIYYQIGELQKTTTLGLASRPLGAAFADPFKYVSVIWPDLRGAFVGYVTDPILALAAVSIVFAVRRRERLQILLTLWLLAPIVATVMITQYGYPRYFLSAIPPLVALAVAGGVRGMRWLRRHKRIPRPRLTAVLVCALFLAPALILDANILANPGTTKYPGEDDYEFSAGWPSGTGLDQIAGALGHLAPRGQSVVAALSFTPWNLAVRFERPERVALGAPIPVQDGAVAHAADGRVLFFIPYGSPKAVNPLFILKYSSLGVPSFLNLSGYHLVDAYTRPRGGVVQGHPQPLTTVELYERD